MADIGKTVKEIWEQSMKAVNKAATNIATSTKQKVDEMNIVTRRKEQDRRAGGREERRDTGFRRPRARHDGCESAAGG